MKVFAHRGASGNYPENTMLAFENAIKIGVKAIELDVQLTKDEELVVIHDYTVDRTTNGSGYVMETTLEEIKKLDAGSWYNKEYSDEKIPTLREVIKKIPNDIFINIEMKSYREDRRNLAKAVMDVVEEFEIEGRVLISSFDHELLKKIRVYSKSVKIGILFAGKICEISSYISSTKINPYSVNLSANFLDIRVIGELKSNGYKVYSYTINERKILEEYSSLDGYFTDYPNNI